MQSNEMKLYVGLSSSNERNECACEDWERRKQKRASIFIEALSFGFKWSVKWKLVKATGTAQRNKANDWSETD
jgi:hypothetical protein